MRFSFRFAAALLAGIPGLAFGQDKPVGMTLEQYQQAGRSLISDRDADGDGRISEAEFTKAATAARRPASAAGATSGDEAKPAASAVDDNRGRMAGIAFARFDANHDGYLDKSEIDAMLAARFARQDANHDGILTEAERNAGRTGRMGQATPGGTAEAR